MTKVFEREYAKRYSKPCPECKGSGELVVVTHPEDGEDVVDGNVASERVIDGDWSYDGVRACSRCNAVGRVPKGGR